jgi:hypothetical protein
LTDQQPPRIVSRPINEMTVVAHDLESLPPELVLNE